MSISSSQTEAKEDANINSLLATVFYLESSRTTATLLLSSGGGCLLLGGDLLGGGLFLLLDLSASLPEMQEEMMIAIIIGAGWCVFKYHY